MLSAQNPSREARCESWLDPSLVSSPPLLNGISSHFELHAVFLDPLGGMGTRDLTRYSNTRVTRDGKFSCIGTKATRRKKMPQFPLFRPSVSQSASKLTQRKSFETYFHSCSICEFCSHFHLAEIQFVSKGNEKEQEKRRRRSHHLSGKPQPSFREPQRNWKSHEYHYPSLLEVREPANQGKIDRTYIWHKRVFYFRWNKKGADITHACFGAVLSERKDPRHLILAWVKKNFLGRNSFVPTIIQHWQRKTRNS